MASLAFPLTSPLGGGSSASGAPSGRVAIGPLGVIGSTGPYQAENYPPGAPYAYGAFNTVTGQPLYNSVYLRWFQVYPPVDGSFVFDLVMPAGYSNSEQWYMVIYQYSASTGQIV